MLQHCKSAASAGVPPSAAISAIPKSDRFILSPPVTDIQRRSALPLEHKTQLGLTGKSIGVRVKNAVRSYINLDRRDDL